MSATQQVQTRTTQDEEHGDNSPHTPFHTFTPQGQWVNNRRNESTLGSAVPLSGLGRTLGEHWVVQTIQDRDQEQPDTPSRPASAPPTGQLNREVQRGGYWYTPWYGPRGRGQAHYRPPRSLQQYQKEVERNQGTRETSNEPLAKDSGLRMSATTEARSHRNQQEPSGISDNRTESGYQADTSGNINTSGGTTTFYPHQRVNQSLPRSEKAKGKQPDRGMNYNRPSQILESIPEQDYNFEQDSDERIQINPDSIPGQFQMSFRNIVTSDNQQTFPARMESDYPNNQPPIPPDFFSKSTIRKIKSISTLDSFN
ncbi:hypothetical protein K435DRAFT_854758 [Dendrothele bispora CBS 962.96]|uniref:Uncharacterized protein n=1 Tax=Dendrothele bispora (strain CBS 962.96) TaxID=1314807 RepID=A0A4S8MCZ4_DENBC|nr:hypothetical protein K435DRAFT_854758 [Dendrothele bispora CBS 962.96]